jgi:hypothetical protein
MLADGIGKVAVTGVGKGPDPSLRSRSSGADLPEPVWLAITGPNKSQGSSATHCCPATELPFKAQITQLTYQRASPPSPDPIRYPTCSGPH